MTSSRWWHRLFLVTNFSPNNTKTNKSLCIDRTPLWRCRVLGGGRSTPLGHRAWAGLHLKGKRSGLTLINHPSLGGRAQNLTRRASLAFQFLQWEKEDPRLTSNLPSIVACFPGGSLGSSLPGIMGENLWSSSTGVKIETDKAGVELKATSIHILADLIPAWAEIPVSSSADQQTPASDPVRPGNLVGSSAWFGSPATGPHCLWSTYSGLAWAG